MLPQYEDRELRKCDVLAILEKLDKSINGIQRKIKLYCLGGTMLMLNDLRTISKDIDFIASRQDFRAISGAVAEIGRKERIRIDIFPDGALPDYDYKDYESHAMKAPIYFKNIKLYYLDTADLILTKALAGRGRDYDDVRLLARSSTEVPKELLIERYNKIQPNPEKENVLKNKFERFVQEFYKK